MKLRAIAVLVLAVLPWAGLHAQKTATFKVSATVVESCEVTTRQAVLRATCTPAATYLIGSNHPRTVIPVNPTGTATLTGVGTGEPVEHTVFGGIPATRVIPAVDSTDIVSVRVFY